MYACPTVPSPKSTIYNGAVNNIRNLIGIQMMQNTGYSQYSNQMMQNTGISQPSNQMMQNHVMKDFVNQVKLMNNSMQALTNLFSRNAAMMNPLEQGLFT